MTIKITALQSLLKQKKIDCFIVPRSDRYQGEYVVAADERLAWLTDFTGSAGIALVFQDHVALFVDGRYTVQAAKQVNSPHVKVIPLADCEPQDYIKKHQTSVKTIAFDPWLMSEKDFSRWAALPGIKLVECEKNPIDSLWTDQPERPLYPVEIHDIKYAGKEAADKLAELYDKLEESAADGAVIMAPDSLCWLLNCRGNDFPYTPLVDWFGIVIKGKGVHIFCDNRKVPPLIKVHLQNLATLHAPSEITEILAEFSKLKIMVDPQLTPILISQKCGKQTIKAPDPIALMKACKTDHELNGMRQAHLRDGVALTKFLSWMESVDEDIETEITIAEKLEAFRQESTLYRGSSFPTIAGFAENGAIVHYRATEQSAKVINESSLLLVDSGAQYPDGTTDVTRTICFGEPSQEQKTNFTLVLQGHIKLAMSLFPEGTTGAQLDVLARYDLWQHGLDYDHGTGHGVGHYLNVHEGPQRISKIGSSVALRPGMILSNEPGYYKVGAYGIRIESLVAVRKAEGTFERPMLCFETLTLAPIDRRLIDETLLTSVEWQWLNDYHAKVRETLLPYLDPDTASWLIDATEEL
jgi:Xaa-Pro aminopeptidase